MAGAGQLPQVRQDGRYFGPFPTKLLAEQLQASAVWLGFVEPDSSVSAQAVGHCYAHECWQPAGGTSGHGGYHPAFMP